MAGRSLLLALFTLLLPSLQLFGQEGRLQRVRNQVRGDQTTDEKGDNQNASANEVGDENHTDWWIFFQDFIWDQDDRSPWPRYFLRYPYQANYPGFMSIHPRRFDEENKIWTDKIDVKNWQMRLSLEDGNDFDGLNRLGGQFFVDTSSRFGLLANWHWYHEQRHCGCSDNLVISDYNLTFRIISVENLSLRTGPGMRVLSDHHDADFGFNWHTSLDCSFVEPFMLSGVLDFGSLGAAGVFHGRITMGVTRHGWELYGGYDFLGVGDAHLQGPLLGVRVWF